MMESFKSIQQKYEEGGDTLRNEVTRRVKAEEDVRKLQARNVFTRWLRTSSKKAFANTFST